MVPMMVPQDAVPHIAQGYPASHTATSYGTSCYTTPHFATASSSPWMGSTVATTAHHPTHHQGGMTVTYHHQQPQQPHHYSAPSPPQHSYQGAAPMGQTEMGGALTGHHPQLHHSVSAPPNFQSGPSPGATNMSENHAAPSSSMQPPQHPATPTEGGQQMPSQQESQQGHAPAPHASVYPQQQHGMSISHGPPQPQHHVQPVDMTMTSPPAMAMYPQVTNGVPGVTFGLHPHHHQSPHASTLNPHAGGHPHPQHAMLFTSSPRSHNVF